MTRPTRHPYAATALVVLVIGVTVWGVRLVALVSSVDRAAVYWSQPRGEAGGLLYAALGDSTGQGIGASHPANGYVGVLARQLAARTGRPVQVINLSASGARMRDVLNSQLPALAALAEEPDLVTVAVGGNDVRAYDRERFAADSAALTEALPAGSYIADVPYFMHGRWQRDAEAAARILADDARANGLRVVGLHDALLAEGWQAMLTQFAADWFHPNDRGHRVWARAFWDQVADDPAVVSGPCRGRCGSPWPALCVDQREHGSGTCPALSGAVLCGGRSLCDSDDSSAWATRTRATSPLRED